MNLTDPVAPLITRLRKGDRSDLLAELAWFKDWVEHPSDARGLRVPLSFMPAW